MKMINLLFHRNSKIVMKIDIPTPCVTSAAFCGPNLDILCVITGAQVFNFDGVPIGEKLGNPAGALFMVTGLGARGMPGYKLDKSVALCAKSTC